MGSRRKRDVDGRWVGCVLLDLVDEGVAHERATVAELAGRERADLENRLEHPESVESAQAIRLEDEADALGRKMRPVPTRACVRGGVSPSRGGRRAARCRASSRGR